MTNEEKLEMNMAAANVLGYLHIDWDADNTIGKFCVVSMDDKGFVVFDIFANPSQCLEVVKKLGMFGEDMISGYEGATTIWTYSTMFGTGIFLKTYEQAVGAASIAILKTT